MYVRYVLYRAVLRQESTHDGVGWMATRALLQESAPQTSQVLASNEFCIYVVCSIAGVGTSHTYSCLPGTVQYLCNYSTDLQH